jgi:rod shape-determining protein MreC
VTFGVFSQVQLGTAWVFGGVRSVWDGYFGLRGAHEDNQRLRQALAQAQVKELEHQAIALRAAQLEQILALRERTPLRTISASVIAGDPTGIFRTVTIDKGSSSGLRKDMAVIAPEGVVGRIVEPPPLYAAKVQLLIDREAGAGAIIERTGVGGVVVGHSDPNGPPLKLEFVSNLSDAKAGDRLVTSGLDSIFPRGITIGQLADVRKGSGLYKDIAVTPAVDFNAIGAVLVVLDPPQTTGPSPAGGIAIGTAPPRPQPPPAAAAPASTPPATPAQAAPARPTTPATTRPATPAGTRPATPPAATPPARPAPRPTPNESTPPPTAAPAAAPTAEPATPPPTPPGRGRR